MVAASKHAGQWLALRWVVEVIARGSSIKTSVESKITAVGCIPAGPYQIARAASCRCPIHEVIAKNLAILRLEETLLTDAGLEHISGLTSLKALYLYDNIDITDAGLAHLTGLTNLKWLNVSDTGISGEGLAHLQGLNSLTALHLVVVQREMDFSS